MSSRQTPKIQVIPGEKGLAAKATHSELRELYEKFGASVFSRCAYVLRDRNRAEDAMQDVFAKALTHYEGFRAEASPLTWLIKIATHHCLNILRAERAGWHARFEREARTHTESTGGPQVLAMLLSLAISTCFPGHSGSHEHSSSRCPRGALARAATCRGGRARGRPPPLCPCCRQ